MEQVDSSDGGNEILRSLDAPKQAMAMQKPILSTVPLLPPKPMQRPAPDPVDAVGATNGPAALHVSSSESGRPVNKMRMSSPTRTSLPIALRPIVNSGAAHNADGAPQTQHQAQLPNSWEGSSLQSPTQSVMPYVELAEPPTTTASEVVYLRTARALSGGGSCDSLGSDGASGAGGSTCGVAATSGNPPSAILDQAVPRPASERSASPPPPPQPSSSTPQQQELPLDDHAVSAEGRAADGEDTEMKSAQDNAAVEVRASASDGGAANDIAAAGENQETVPNLEEIIAALPPGPIHVTVAVRVGAGGGRRPRGGAARGAEKETRSGYMRGHACGLFDVPRYLAGRDCIHNGNKWMSRSNFEKVGGSKMAKWYRSILVLPDLEPLGEWLERHGMPVTKGPPRRSRKRNAESGDEQQGDAAEDEDGEGSPDGAAPMLVDLAAPTGAEAPVVPKRNLPEQSSDSPATVTGHRGELLSVNLRADASAWQSEDQQPQPQNLQNAPASKAQIAAAVGCDEAPQRHGLFQQEAVRPQSGRAAAVIALSTTQQAQHAQHLEGQHPTQLGSQPLPSSQQQNDGRNVSSEGRAADGEDTEMKPAQDNAAVEARASASDGGAANDTAAAGENQETVPNLEEIIAALPPGPIHVTVAVRVGAGGGRRPRGGGARVAEEDTRSGYMRGHARGLFDVPRYLAGRDCIHNGNKWMSRSNFEKVGGSKMAKWYRSIRVLPELEPLGEWLERHGVPVAKGPARRSRKKAAESGDEQGGQEEDVADPGSQEEGVDEGAPPMPIDPAVAPMPQVAPAAVTGLPPLSSFQPPTPLPQLPAQAAAAVAAAVAASRSAAVQAAVRPTGTAIGPALPQSEVEPSPHFPLDVLAERLLPHTPRNSDRKFLQALLNTLPEQLLQRSAAHPDAADAKDEDDHDFYGPQDPCLDYGSYAAARGHGAMRAGSGSLGVAYPAAAVRAKAMSVGLSSDLATISAATARATGAAGASDAKALVAAAAVAAAAHYHRGSDLPVADPNADVHDARLRLRALQRLFSSNEPLSMSSQALQLDPQDLQQPLDLQDLQQPLDIHDLLDGQESGSHGGNRHLLPLSSEQQLALQQLLQIQLQVQLMEQQMALMQQLRTQRQQQQQQQQLMAEEEDYYYEDEAEGRMEEEDVMSHMGSMELDLGRARADPSPLPQILHRAPSRPTAPYNTHVRRFRSSESDAAGVAGLERAPASYLGSALTGGTSARGMAAPRGSVRPDRRLPLQPLPLPPAPPSPSGLESAAVLARELAVLQGLDLAAAGLGLPAHDHVPRATAPAPHSYPVRTSEDACFKPRWNGLSLYYLLMASGRENRF